MATLNSRTEVTVTLNGAAVARYIVEPGEYIIGRSPECELRVEAELVSRRHAKLTVKPDHLLIADLGSSNGTSVNGKPVSGAVRLWPNQKVAIGAATLEFKRQRQPGQSTQGVLPRETDTQSLLPQEFQSERKYEIGGLVAQGGMGAVLSAREVTTERTVAMKVMLDTASPDDVARFVNEAKITGQLEHPNIVPVHELGVDENEQVYYTMKYVRGITLKKILELIAAGVPATIAKYPLGNLLTVFQKVCDAVAFAHSKGVIHRDLKPENVMIGDFGEVLVMDWGLAKAISSNAVRETSQAPLRSMIRTAADTHGSGAFTMAGVVMGTPQYMAPEQARGEVETLDSRADIYALGAMLYHILALRPPIDGTAHDIVERVARGEILPLTPSMAGTPLPHLPDKRIPDSLAAVVRKAMSFSPSQRYSSVPEFQHDVEAYQNGFATSAEQASLQKQLLLFIRRNRMMSVGALLIATLCAALAIHVFISQQKLKATFARLKSTAPTFHAQALALVDEAPNRPAALEEALANVEHAIELDPGEAEFRAAKGRILETLGKLTAARRAFLEALARDPAERSARENLPLVESLLREEKGELSNSALATLQRAYQGQGRAAESLVLLQRTGSKDKARLAAGWAAILKKAGVNANPTVLGDGTLDLDLYSVRLDDLSFLRGMPVSRLNLGRGNVTDLTPLAGMPLRRLNCPENPIADLSPLSGMPLAELIINNAEAADLSPLRGLPLEQLSLNPRNFDLSILQESPLKVLTLTGFVGDNLQTISGLKLVRFSASHSGITDLLPLKQMPLKEVSLDDNSNLTDLTPLAGLKLQKLRVSGSGRLSDLSALKGMPLEDVDVAFTAVTDISAIAANDLRYLTLAGTPFSASEQLQRFSKLEHLGIRDTPIADLKPLIGTNIKSIELQNCFRLDDLSPLAKLLSLRIVSVPAHIWNLDALRGKAGLEWIGYGNAFRVSDLGRHKGEAEQFWKMHDLEKQIRGADPQHRLRPSKFPFMMQRFPNAKQFGTHWYASFPAPATWSAAKTLAEQMGGHLVTITSAAEDEFIRKSFWFGPGAGVWIGGTADQPTGPWKWVTGEPWEYTRWGKWADGSEPDGRPIRNEPTVSGPLRVGFFNLGEYSNNPAWNDVPDQNAKVNSFIVEWED